MVDSEALLPPEKQKNQSPVSSWVYYLSLVLAIVAILLAVIATFKKVIILFFYLILADCCECNSLYYSELKCRW